MMMIMNGECYDDCNVAANITAGKVIWMLYLDRVDCNVVGRGKPGLVVTIFTQRPFFTKICKLEIIFRRDLVM